MEPKKEMTTEEIKSKQTTAGILALLLGWLGIQYFYLGKTQAGVLVLVSQIVVMIISLVTCGIGAFLYIIYVIFIVQGIMMLTMDPKVFKEKYIDSTNSFPLF